jgi:quinol monooxygenase YgiN
MAAETVRVVARITAQIDRVDELKSILLNLVGPTRKERGCISYQLLQNKADPADFTFVEEWESEAAIAAHLSTSHVQDAFSKAASLLAAAPDIRSYFTLA